MEVFGSGDVLASVGLCISGSRSDLFGRIVGKCCNVENETSFSHFEDEGILTIHERRRDGPCLRVPGSLIDQENFIKITAADYLVHTVHSELAHMDTIVIDPRCRKHLDLLY